jgi:DNA-binding transcriptional ArsR family regulator
MEDRFIAIASLVCEPARAGILWNLLDGRAYTATELAVAVNISSTSASNHLAKLLEADLLKVDKQGKHRYYSFSHADVAYAVESLANLASRGEVFEKKKDVAPSGLKFCRTCYDHLAGYVGVKIFDSLVQKQLLARYRGQYRVTTKGQAWLAEFGIQWDEIRAERRPFIRECLDWSERRPHLAGRLGSLLLERMLERGWFRRVRESRELILTANGQKGLLTHLNLEL